MLKEIKRTGLICSLLLATCFMSRQITFLEVSVACAIAFAIWNIMFFIRSMFKNIVRD